MTIRQTLMPFLMAVELLDDGRLYAKVRRAVELDDGDRYVRTARAADLTIRPAGVAVLASGRRRRDGIDTSGGAVTVTKRGTATVIEVELEQLDIEADAAWRLALSTWMQLRRRRDGRGCAMDGQWCRLAALSWGDVAGEEAA